MYLKLSQVYVDSMQILCYPYTVNVESTWSPNGLDINLEGDEESQSQVSFLSKWSSLNKSDATLLLTKTAQNFYFLHILISTLGKSKIAGRTNGNVTRKGKVEG